jgi:DNA-directed RNA polymerase specialized sigma24 family protein
MTGFQETLVHPEVSQTLKEAPMDADLRAANQAHIRQFIAGENAALLRTLRMYVAKAGLASGEAARRAAEDLLNEVVVEALEHAERFNPALAPMAWLLGIAANLIRRWQADLARRSRREPLARDLQDQDDPLSMTIHLTALPQ